MQSIKKLSSKLKDLFTAVEEEAKANPEFAEKLDAILNPQKKEALPSLKPKQAVLIEVPDVFQAFGDKGPSEFRFWLRTYGLDTLKQIVRVNGYDPQRKTQKWTEPDKFIELISDQTEARRNRGTSFLAPRDALDKK